MRGRRSEKDVRASDFFHVRIVMVIKNKQPSLRRVERKVPETLFWGFVKIHQLEPGEAPHYDTMMRPRVLRKSLTPPPLSFHPPSTPSHPCCLKVLEVVKKKICARARFMMQLRKIFDDKNALQDACSEDFSRTKRERRLKVDFRWKLKLKWDLLKFVVIIILWFYVTWDILFWI